MNHQTKQKIFLSNYLKIHQSITIVGSILSFSLFFSSCDLAQAQISADDTVSTEVNNSDHLSEITGGTTKGENLFHSFQEFSVASGNTAFFNNATNIDNIISRVTGGSISNIDGLIRANGNANLILINPSGINFGANAQLDIGGSFLGSTADSLIFEDGTSFSATNADQNPLLTVSVPVGLQLGQNSGAINVQGTGHNLSLATPVFSPLTRGEVSGLKVKSGQTLALVGNNLSLTGGTLTAESGRIELGSIATGKVALNSSVEGWTIDYSDVSIFSDLNLSQKALVDASGNSSGSINLQGRQVSLQDGSAVLIQNLGARALGNISINAAESLSIIGTEPEGEIASGLYTEALGATKGGDVDVTTQQLFIEDGASIISTTSSSAPGGDVRINATESLKFVGFSEISPNILSVVSVQTFGAGNAGNVTVSTKTVTALDGANISSITGGREGTGSGGNINVDATESVELIAVNPVTFAPSQITAGSGSQGNAGNVMIDTARLTVQDGARVDASATAAGNAGNVMINASESIEVSGSFPGSINPSLITASANILDPTLREFFGLPDVPNGNSGSITINTPSLKVMDGGQVTVRNDGTGDAGDLYIQANAIDINTNGGITAAVEQGVGGTIELQVADSLNLSSGGQIASDNSGAGDGGEIRISTNSLNISDRSFITTTTFGAGKGGDITLNANESINLTGTGFEQFQQTFQANALNGTLKAGTRGTGIFIGTAADGRSGNLKIDTNTLRLSEGAIIFSPIFTSGIGGDIEVNATDIEIASSALQIDAGTNSINSGAAGDLVIDTERLMLRDGGTIINATFGEATGGDIDINATEVVNLKDTPDGSLLFTGIYSGTSIGTGKGGDLNLKTTNLNIDDGFISSNTGGFIRDGLGIEGGGDGGKISVEVEDTIEISGIPSGPRFASGISSTSFTSGAAGNIEISTSKLLVRDGSEIVASAIGSGAGGDLTINATDSIELNGTTTMNNMKRGGLIATSGREAFPGQEASGASGDINITTGNLTVEDGASIDVQSLGTGNVGNLKIEVEDSILLNREGTISAATNSDTGGDIDIVADNIFWLGNSTTTATASGNADGGNINIRANNVVVLEASQLTADANMGVGGRIDINTQGLFICDECRVSASATSQVGVDGVVNIDTLDLNQNLEIVDIPIQLTQPKDTVALACSVTQKPNASKLTISGRGGLPPRPNEPLTSESIVSFEVLENSPQTIGDKNIDRDSEHSPPKDIPDVNDEHDGIISEDNAELPAPARNWYTNDRGVVVLTAQSTTQSTAAPAPGFNHPNCHVR